MAGVIAVLFVGLIGSSCTTGSPPATTPASTRTAAPSATTPGGPAPTTAVPSGAGPATDSKTFAVIGDFGTADAHEAAVAALVKSWKPAFVIAVGDDYYNAAGGQGAATYDRSVGAFYCRWLADVHTTGSRCPDGGARTNAFFPALGNHDYSDATPALSTYLGYFTLPGAGFTNTSGNERYYDFIQGPVHFFVLNSNPQEPDGTGSRSVQAAWLKKQLSASTSAWNIVYDHHPPYSSDGTHGSSPGMRWPFAQWGADAVISGHAHTYERIRRDGIVYFVNGLGGAPRYTFATPVAGSRIRYQADWGAQRVTATATSLRFTFQDVSGKTIDSYLLTRS